MWAELETVQVVDWSDTMVAEWFWIKSWIFLVGCFSRVSLIMFLSQISFFSPRKHSNLINNLMLQMFVCITLRVSASPCCELPQIFEQNKC